jgi:WD40 repeat protein
MASIWQHALTKFHSETLKELKSVTAAFVKSDTGPQGCLPGTREKLLNEVMDWFADDGPSVYWLRGLAGTGKTTIARSVADLAEQQGLLGASFFFSRTDIALQRAGAVLPTLAYQLAKWRPALRQPLCDAINSDREIAERTMKEQVECLFVQALSHTTSPVPRALLVVDALDECGRIGDCEGGLLVPLLVECLGRLPFSVKVFITSRDEPSICRMFDSLLAEHSMHKAALHIDIEEKIVNADIELYLYDKLGSMTDVPSEPAWPPPAAITEITRRANGLFVYAVTIAEYIQSDSLGDPPVTLLDDVLSTSPVNAQYHYQDLDILYLKVLDKPAAGRKNTDHLRERIRDAAASVVLAQEPLSWNALSNLTGLPTATLKVLSSVILESSDGKIRPFHASFADFIVDEKRCTNPVHLVNVTHHHRRLAGRCLAFMNKALRYDICDLSQPGTRNEELPNLERVLQSAAPAELRYACTHWAAHLSQASSPDTHLLDELAIFCREHLLHWFEVMSLITRLSACDEILAATLRWCKASVDCLHARGKRKLTKRQEHAASMPDLAISLLQDAEQMLQTYRIPMASHALHVYHSALVTMPRCFLLDVTPETLRTSIPELLSPRELGWDPKRVLEGHTSAVFSVVFSPDATCIASGSDDNTVRIWDTQTGRQLSLLEGHTSTVRSVVFSPEGTRIASGSDDNTMRIWDTQTGGELALLNGHTDTVSSVVFSPDGNRIASSSFDETLRIWDTQTGEQLALLEGHTSAVRSIAFSPDGTCIASGAHDNTVRIWDTQSGRQLARLDGHTDAVRSAVFSPDGTRIASGSHDNTVRIWDTQTGRQLTRLDGHTSYVYSVVFSPDGTRIASGSDDSTVRIWDKQKGGQLALLKGHTSAVVSAVFSPHGTRIASGSDDNTVRIWDTQTSGQLALLDGHTSYVYSVMFSPDGTRIASGSDDKTVRIWDTQIGRELAPLQGHAELVYSVVFSPDGTRIVSGSDDHTVCIWDTQTGRQLALLEGHTVRVESVVFYLDGTRIVLGSGDKTVRIWDMQTGRQPALLKGYTESVLSVVFSPDGTRIASGSGDHTVHIWDTQTGRELALLDGHTETVWSVVFSPDRTCIASGSSDKTVRIWDTQTGTQLALIDGHTDDVNSIVFSPDGTRIASGSRDNTARIWDTQTGGQLALLDGHTDNVNSVVFSPDGTRIASGSDDSTVRIWDTQTSGQLALLDGHTDNVNSVVFSPDGTRTVSGSDDKTVRIWDTQTGGQLAQLQHQYGVRSVAYSADMKYLVTRDIWGQENQWDINSIGALCVRCFATVC